MSTYEDRIEALEQRIADIELERLYEKRKTATSTPSEQAYDIKQVNHRLTMLLGVTSGQEHTIRTMQGDMDLRFDAVDVRFNQVDARLNNIEATMATKEDVSTLKGDITAFLEDRMQGSMDALEKRVLDAFQQLVTIIDTRLPAQEK
ncbi:MAG: hypothetical protein H0V70_27645 [Ktedonobacteraceae bacterium]|nr:hypothetical protein [Ktedonobacteraceae bacterium]